jgi:plastocyanin
MSRINRQAGGALIAILLLGAGVFLPRLGASRDGVREIRITARGMAFHVEDIAGVNPPLRVAARERVRLTLRNEDRGVVHDLSIAEWGVRTGGVEWGGEKSVLIDVPDAGAAAYQCTPHSAMMSGRILISR